MFWIKKLVALLLSPLGLLLVLLVGGLIAAWRKRGGPWPRRIIVASSLSLVVVCCGPTGELLLSPLEDHHPPLTDLADVADATHIIVLGGGYTARSDAAVTSELSAASTVRLAEGIRLHQALDDTMLVVSGASVHQPGSTAGAMARLATAIGVSQDEIIISDTPRDTAEEAAALKALTDDRASVIVVTSASHMPRAMLLFDRLNITAVPAPTHHLTQGTIFHRRTLWPSAQNVRRVERALYEYTGLLWISVGGS